MKPLQSVQEIAKSIEPEPSPEAIEFVSSLMRLPEPLRREFIDVVRGLAQRLE